MAETDVDILEMIDPGPDETKRVGHRSRVAIGRKFKEQVSRIKANGLLSGPGKDEAIRDARLERDAELTALESDPASVDLSMIGNAINEGEAMVEKLVAPPAHTGPDPSGNFALARAIEESNQQARGLVILRSAESLPQDILTEIYEMTEESRVQRAFEKAPPRIVKFGSGYVVEPWVKPEAVARVKQARAAALNPEAAERLRILRDQHATLKHWSGLLRGSMQRAAPLGPAEGSFIVDGKKVSIPVFKVQ